MAVIPPKMPCRTKYNEELQYWLVQKQNAQMDYVSYKINMFSDRLYARYCTLNWLPSMSKPNPLEYFPQRSPESTAWNKSLLEIFPFNSFNRKKCSLYSFKLYCVFCTTASMRPKIWPRNIERLSYKFGVWLEVGWCDTPSE